MENIAEIHKRHIELESNIQFYKQEINFLLKILAREYTISITNKAIVKLLDSYWEEFEKHFQKLQQIGEQIKKGENSVFFQFKYENGKSDWDYSNEEEKKIVSEYLITIDSLMIIKESLYSYMESDMKGKVELSLL